VAFVSDRYGLEVGFLDWLTFGLPFVAVSLPIAFLFLTKWAFPVRLKELPGGRARIESGLREMVGSPGREVLVLAVSA
jgi:solute carrier family 13 (sodium-dependent dicarboxylate transporter), member 2/3/5